MLPFIYALRNLTRRPGRCLQLVFGSAMVVLLLVSAAAINQGMKRVLIASGSPRNVILLGAGSEESIERSEVSAIVPEIVASSVPGLRKVLGQPAVSAEVHYNGFAEILSGDTGPNEMNGRTDREGADANVGEGGERAGSQALFRGVTHAALWVHREVRLIEGAFPRPGEVMAGRLAHQKLNTDKAALRPGRTIRFNGATLRVSGIFDAPGTVMEAEIWMNTGDLLALTQRDTLSCVVIALDEAEFADADTFTKQRLDLELIAMRESDYYAKLAGFYAPIRWMAWLCAVLIAVGAMFGGLNTLYAAFASRIREFGALQAIGFRRRAVLASLIQEAAFAGATGALIATILALTWLDGVTIPFSIGAFTIVLNPGIIGFGLIAGIGLGALGALPPAWSCLRPSLTSTLRAG